MSVPIRKLLSRKFNNDLLNLAGLLTRVLLSTFPFTRTVVLKRLQASQRLLSGLSSQLREQFQIFQNWKPEGNTNLDFILPTSYF